MIRKTEKEEEEEGKKIGQKNPDWRKKIHFRCETLTWKYTHLKCAYCIVYCILSSIYSKFIFNFFIYSINTSTKYFEQVHRYTKVSEQRQCGKKNRCVLNSWKPSEWEKKTFNHPVLNQSCTFHFHNFFDTIYDDDEALMHTVESERIALYSAYSLFLSLHKPLI